MSKIEYIYQLNQTELNELENINRNSMNDTTIWINEKLQEAFNTGRDIEIKKVPNDNS